MKLSPGFIYTFLCALLWAFMIILTRVILNSGENPYNLAFWTTLFSFPFWIWLSVKERKNIIKIKRTDFFLLAGIALISSVAGGFLEIFALKYSPAINFSLLFRTVTAFTILFAYFFLGEAITRKKIILMSLLFGGSYFLTTNGYGITFSRGDIFTLSQAALVAFGTNILSKFATKRMTPDTVAAGRNLIAFLPILVISVVNTSIHVPHLWFPMLVYSILNCIFFLLIFRAFQNSTATFVTMIMSFTPVLVSLIAIPVLGEILSPIQLIGGALIVLAGILVEKLKI